MKQFVLPKTALIALGLSGLLAACSDTERLSQPTDHTLIGKIWDVQAKAFIETDDVIERLKNTEYLLLGEKHDNPAHHEHQSWFIRQLDQLGCDASVAFEMIDLQQGQQLAQHTVHTTSQLIALLQPDDPGWDYQRYYRDVFAATIKAGYPVVAANLRRDRLVRYAMNDEYPLPMGYRELLEQVPFNAQQTDHLMQEIRESHCNMMPEESLPTMVRAQRLRDVVMAVSLRHSQSSVKVLIAGSGHVRNDRGVPIYLESNKSILSVGFTEIDPTRNNIEDYLSPETDNALPFDIVWFTPRIERGDPCEQFKQTK
jgi:uncharacterized iron-regulated protein